MIYKITLHKQQVYIRPFNLIPVIAEIYLYYSLYFHLHIFSSGKSNLLTRFSLKC